MSGNCAMVMQLNQYPLDFLPAYPALPLTAEFKLTPEDFQVVETLGFEPCGSGEHVFLNIRKRNLTTESLISEVAKAFGVLSRDIGVCGLKDKHAITEQWLSVVWPIKQDIPQIAAEHWQVLQAVRHNKKLKRGIHKANAFCIRLRNIMGDTALLEQRLRLIADNGFPNYFGEQRFGIEGRNVEKAALLFTRQFKCKPFQRSMYYSAARSYLFNCYLSARIAAGNWNQPIAGDCFNLAGSNAVFGPEAITDEIRKRMAAFDIHPMGVMCGAGKIRLTDDALALLQGVNAEHEILVQGLIAADVGVVMRPLRALATGLRWQITEQECELQFSLPTGSYATALLHEVCQLHEAT